MGDMMPPLEVALKQDARGGGGGGDGGGLVVAAAAAAADVSYPLAKRAKGNDGMPVPAPVPTHTLPSSSSSSLLAGIGFDDSGDDDDVDWDSCASVTDAAQIKRLGLGAIPPERLARLSPEQLAVVLAVKAGRSVFFSGSAGTGKSYLLKLLIEYLPTSTTHITASTGLAAVAIGGTTLHSFAGVGLGVGKTDDLIKRMRWEARARWRSCRILIVDELSMISGELFDTIDAVGRKVRSDGSRPFGGIQLIFAGDFLQLPPVRATSAAYQALSWKSSLPTRIMLTHVFRQQDDPTFIALLSHLRVGVLTHDDRALLLEAATRTLPDIDGIMPTKLHAKRIDTALENDAFLDALATPAVSYNAMDWGDASHVAALSKNCQAQTVVRLKIGAQVMLLKNLNTSNGLCNGSRGVVVGYALGTALAPVAAVPTSTSTSTLKLVSTHARTTRSASPSLPSVPEEREVDAAIDGAIDDAPEMLPRVRFENGMVCVIARESWQIVVGGDVVAVRTQVPLVLAWALTIHKSQGMMLDRAEINARGVFEKGQLYVAVSRMRTMAGVRLTNFTSDAVRTDQNVVEWYASLATDTLASTTALLATRDEHYPTTVPTALSYTVTGTVAAAAAAAAATIVVSHYFA